MTLALRGAAFAYRPGEPVFEGLDLTIHAGEVLCILGPNGCGKTTLLRCCAGLLRLSHGWVQVDGTDIGDLDRRATARRIGFVPQSHDATFPYSVRDVVLMGRTPHLSPWSSPSPRDEELAVDAVLRVGLQAKLDHAYSTLSGGERQLALLARALCQAPALLLMDEPVAHLDLKNQWIVLQLMKRLAAGGLSVTFSSHDPGHAFRVAHRVALIHAHGRLTVGAPADVLAPKSLSDAYGIAVTTCVLRRAGRPDVPHVVVDDGGVADV
jgi:iron complex transport system ATP-binding protein